MNPMPSSGREPHIDQQLRQSLGGQAFPTPEGSWDRIAQSLDRSARRKAWFMGSAAVLALLFIGSGLWFSLYNKEHKNKQAGITQSSPTATQPASPSPAPATQGDGNPHPEPATALRNPVAQQPVATRHSRQIRTGNNNRQAPGNTDHRLPAVDNHGHTGEDNGSAQGEISLPAPEGLRIQGFAPLRLHLPAPETGKQAAAALKSKRRAMQQQPALRLGFGSTPSYTFDVLQTAAQQAGFLHQDYIGIRRSQEAPAAALSAGLDLSLRLRKGMVLQTGAWLQEYSISQRYDYRIVNIPSYRGGVTDIYGNKLIEAYFTSANPEQVTYTGRSRYRSLRIPLQAGWSHSIGQGFDVVGLGGISSAFLLEESGKQIHYSNLSLSNDALLRMRKLQWSALVQVGIEKSICRHLWLGSSLRWEAALHNRYIQGSPLHSAPRQTGIQFNLQYRIY